MIVHVKPENNSISAHVPSGDPVHISVHARVTPGTDITVEPLSVTTNGTYTAPSGTAYSPVTVDVPEPEPIDVEPLSVTANGTYTAPSGKAYSPVTVNVEASNSVPAKDVNFYDYDGTIVASYTAAEFAALNAMPANPSHAGLTAQGWNWTLNDAKTYVAAYGMLEIGQMYVSSSGNTEIDIELDGADLSPVLMIELDGAANVFWGDGAATNATGASIGNGETVFLPHTYSSPGTYTISIVLTSGSELGFSGPRSASNYSGLFSDKSAWSDSARYSSAVKAIRLGPGLVFIGQSAFTHCSSLTAIPMPSSFNFTLTSFNNSYFRHITIPSGNTYFTGVARGWNLESISIPKSITTSLNEIYDCPLLKRVSCPPNVSSITSFYDCYALERISIPSGVTSLGLNAFYHNYALKKIDVPSGVTSIKNYTFYCCFTLTHLTIPSGVTSIGKQAFSQCSSMKELHVQATTPPTIESNTFASFPGSAVIYVPSASVNDYKTATNWSTYANQIYGE